MTSRRELLGTLSILWLARAVRAADAGPRSSDLDTRLRHLDEASRALAARRMPPVEWQRAAEQACAGIDLADLCRRADFDRVIARLPLLDRGTSAAAVELLPGQAFTPKIFAMGRGRAIIPHGHRNMVSQHVVLQGTMHGRHYERVRDAEKHLYVRPTIDRTFRSGDLSSISDQRDNVHWFVAESDRAYTLDCIVDAIDDRRGYRYHIDFVDPRNAARESDGTLRMPRLGLEECLSRYG
jgi:hypothetical protein